VVRRVTIDWGDGSTPTVIDLAVTERTCLDEPTAYPASEQGATADHVYGAAGSYPVTATIVSTGCDGKDGQVATASLAVAPAH
jgi:hypothetical protein